MAAPNILNISTVTGKTAVANVTSTSASMLTNSSGSNQVYKVNSLIVGNVDPANTIYLTAGIVRSSIFYKFASTIPIPANASIVVLSKDSNFYLEEGDTLNILANANNGVHAICSYEIIG